MSKTSFIHVINIKKLLGYFTFYIKDIFYTNSTHQVGCQIFTGNS